MIKKINRYYLFLLLFISVVNIIAYTFSDWLPDNMYAISSHSTSDSTILYLFSSFFAFVSKFTGKWIVLVPILYIPIAATVQRNRFSALDKAFVYILTLSILGFSLMIERSLVGDNLLYFVEKSVPSWLIGLLTFSLSLFSFYICLRGNKLKILYQQLDRVSKIIAYKLNLLSILLKKTLNRFKRSSVKKSLESKISLKMRTSPKEDPLQSKGIETQINPKSIETLEVDMPEEIDDLTLRENQTLTSESQSDTPIESSTSEKFDTSFKPKASRKPQFFKTKDLISCIESDSDHNNFISPDSIYFDRITESIEEKLNEFNIQAKIINILKGPVVDTFELDLGAGVKVSKVTGLSDDIGLALNGAKIRIVPSMPGKSTIGIEVPRSPREIIFLDEVLKSKEFISSKHRLPVAMGKDAFGDVTIVDLAAMPHMLVAGATGAGKSVFLNTLLVSLVIKMRPEQMKLILIDPKQLELALYEDLPHLMLPIITEHKSASIALLWAVQEMERRYSILKELGVKSIDGFNKKVKTASNETLFKIHKFYEDSTDEGYELPYLVIVIDEFADLILTKSGKEIEDNVNRLAAKARAAGIHIVLATQRPSTNVVTGVIKSNFPTRVAFRVTSNTDSRVILDQNGAEKLLGKGDMLYKHGVHLMRLHSSYVDEVEIEQLVEMLSKIPKSYNQAALNFLENGEDEFDSSSDVKVSIGPTGDTLYDEAVKVVIESGSASASMIQRRLRVGYNRAANLIEEMERQGVVGPAQGSKPREVLVSSVEE